VCPGPAFAASHSQVPRDLQRRKGQRLPWAEWRSAGARALSRRCQRRHTATRRAADQSPGEAMRQCTNTHQLGSTSSQYVYEAQKTRPDAQLNFVRNRPPPSTGDRHNVHYWTTSFSGAHLTVHYCTRLVFLHAFRIWSMPQRINADASRLGVSVRRCKTRQPVDSTSCLVKRNGSRRSHSAVPTTRRRFESCTSVHQAASGTSTTWPDA
jgi:hypothetical protein